jgi:hypothetical protein
MASPPFLVMLGLTLPDSRILRGVASIGLTLANIAIILPYLRQRILDSMHAREGALVHEQTAKEQTNLASDAPNATQPVDLHVGNSVLTPVSAPCEKEHQSPALPCSATVKSVCSAVMEPFGCLNVDPEVTPHTTLLPPVGKTDDGQIPPKIPPSLDADSSEMHVSASHLFAREGRDALYIPLPVPDTAEVAFFDSEDATLPNGDRHTVPEEHSTIEDNGLLSVKACIHGVYLLLTLTPSRVSSGIVGLSLPIPQAHKCALK